MLRKDSTYRVIFKQKVKQKFQFCFTRAHVRFTPKKSVLLVR